MCGPSAAAAFTLGSSVLSGIGAFGQGRAEAKALKQQAGLREQEAGRIRSLGAIEAQQVERRNRRALGQQLVDFAAAGIDPTFGTPLDVAFDTAQQGELDVLEVTTRTAFNAEARQHEAASLRSRAKSAKQAGFFSGASRILKGVSAFSELR